MAKRKPQNITVGIADGKVLNGCGFYRSHGPLSDLCRSHPVRAVRLPETLDHLDFLYLDWILAPRVIHPSMIEALHHAKRYGCRVWIDWDDDPWSVPEWSPAYKSVRDQELEVVQRTLDMADLVTVSTPHLWRRITDRTKSPVDVVPNAVSAISPEMAAPRRRDKIRVAWRGSATHLKDLEAWREPFEQIAAQPDRYQLHIFGMPQGSAFAPDWLNALPVVWEGWYELVDFYRRWAEVAPDFVIYPLADIPFNHSKSNIAWLEATSVGAALFTNFQGDEWMREGILDGWGPDGPIFDEEVRQQKVAKSIREIADEYDYDEAQRLRYRLLLSYL